MTLSLHVNIIHDAQQVIVYVTSKDTKHADLVTLKLYNLTQTIIVTENDQPELLTMHN